MSMFDKKPTRHQRQKMIEQFDSDPEMKDRRVGAIKASGCHPDQFADAFITVHDKLQDTLGGEPDYTGKTKTYSNGAVARQAKCRQCKLPYWLSDASGMPDPYCVDCMPTKRFLEET